MDQDLLVPTFVSVIINLGINSYGRTNHHRQHQWKKWKSALKKTFGMKAGVTSYTLGSWLHNDISQLNWFHHQSSSSLFQRFGHIWRVWRRDSRRGRIGVKTKNKYFTTATRTPPSAIKATIKYVSHNRIQFTGSAPMINDDTTLYSNHLSANMLPLYINDEGADLQHLYSCLTNGSVHIVSDGSYLNGPQIGAAGWVIETTDGKVHLEGSFGTVGPKEIQSACRSELSGIYYALT